MGAEAAASRPRGLAEPAARAAETLRFRVNRHVAEAVVDIPGSCVRHDLRTGMEAPFRAVRCRGGNNAVHLGPGADASKLSFDVLGHDNRVVIGSNCLLKGSVGIRGDGRVVLIGAQTTFNNVAIICKYNGHVFIGRDCMFSSGIEIRTSDSHAIIDTVSMTAVNASEGVHIGDHVWVGKGAVIQKGAFVADDTVVAMSSFVRGRFEESGTILAGAPARIVRRDRSWARDELVDPATQDIYAWRRLELL